MHPDLPSLPLNVLEAMARSDLCPPVAPDSPAVAVQRRLPDPSPEQAAEALAALNALGLTKVLYIRGMVTPTATVDLRKWITEEGWKAMGMVSEPGRGGEN